MLTWHCSLTGNSTLTSEPSNSRTLHVMAALLLPAAGMCTTVPPVTTTGPGICCCWYAWSAVFTPRPPPSSSSDGRKRLRERRLNVLRRKPIIFQMKEKAGQSDAANRGKSRPRSVYAFWAKTRSSCLPDDYGDHEHTSVAAAEGSGATQTCRELA